MNDKPETELAQLIAGVTDLKTGIAEVTEQGRLTLELVRAVAELVAPKGNRSGPTLDELLATLIVQIRELTSIARATRAAVARLEQRSAPNGGATSSGRSGLPREARP